MSRNQMIVVLAFALAGLALAILIADWSFTEPGVRTGARAIFGVVGVMGGAFVGKWFVFGSPERKVGRAE